MVLKHRAPSGGRHRPEPGRRRLDGFSSPVLLLAAVLLCVVHRFLRQRLVNLV